MDPYQIAVYEVVRQYEMDVFANSEWEAKTIAINIVSSDSSIPSSPLITRYVAKVLPPSVA